VVTTRHAEGVLATGRESGGRWIHVAAKRRLIPAPDMSMAEKLSLNPQ
jgi:hypothetical protein